MTFYEQFKGWIWFCIVATVFYIIYRFVLAVMTIQLVTSIDY